MHACPHEKVPRLAAELGPWQRPSLSSSTGHTTAAPWPANRQLIHPSAHRRWPGTALLRFFLNTHRALEVILHEALHRRQPDRAGVLRLRQPAGQGVEQLPQAAGVAAAVWERPPAGLPLLQREQPGRSREASDASLHDSHDDRPASLLHRKAVPLSGGLRFPSFTHAVQGLRLCMNRSCCSHVAASAADQGSPTPRHPGACLPPAAQQHLIPPHLEGRAGADL